MHLMINDIVPKQQPPLVDQLTVPSTEFEKSDLDATDANHYASTPAMMID